MENEMNVSITFAAQSHEGMEPETTARIDGLTNARSDELIGWFVGSEDMPLEELLPGCAPYSASLALTTFRSDHRALISRSPRHGA